MHPSLTGWAPLCRPGLPARLFFEMEGVLISSRFFLLNIFSVLLPSIAASRLSFSYNPPTHPRTRHLCALSGGSVPSGPTFSHGSCLSVFLLTPSHIEPLRLTDAHAPGAPASALRARTRVSLPQRAVTAVLVLSVLTGINPDPSSVTPGEPQQVVTRADTKPRSCSVRR